MVTRTNYENTAYENTAAGLEGDATIVRDMAHHSDGPGPDVMDAASLKGDDVVNAPGDRFARQRQ